MIKNTALWCESNGSIQHDPYSLLSPNYLFFFPIFSSALVRRIIQGESAVEKKEICAAYKYPSKVLAGKGGSEMKWIEHVNLDKRMDFQ